eukprot:437625_1
MGRKKISIEPISHPSTRRATFEKRRIGLFKKAMELSILCDCTISLTLQRKVEGDLQIYSSEPFDEVIDNYKKFEGTYRLLTNDHIDVMVPGKMSSNQVGYQVIKHSHGTKTTIDDHETFQRTQMYNRVSTIPSISEMEIIPTAPSSMFSPPTDLYSMPPTHPTFNGYIPDFNYNNPTLMPTINKKRSYNDMTESDYIMDVQFQPPMQQFKIQKSSMEQSTSNTSHTSTVDTSNWIDFELTPPTAQPLRLQLRDEDEEIQKSTLQM